MCERDEGNWAEEIIVELRGSHAHQTRSSFRSLVGYYANNPGRDGVVASVQACQDSENIGFIPLRREK